MEITVDGRYVTLLLPARFYLHHLRLLDRPSGVLVSESARYVRVKLDREAMESLWEAADDYANSPDIVIPPGLRSSAKATLSVLKEPMEEFR